MADITDMEAVRFCNDKARQAALRHCEMCRDIVGTELPNVASRIEPHLREMERLLS